MAQGYPALTEKEKQTLRLIVRGHDAKSTARHLGLSVHTINERLREARRKLSVSSSREAARLLLARESGSPDSVGDKLLGEAQSTGAVRQDDTPDGGRGPARRADWTLAGVVVMSFVLGLLALALQSQPASSPTERPAQASAVEVEVVRSARDWLAVVDAGRWDESWRATGEAFRALNTPQAWADASETARVPLGAMVSRTHLTHDSVPAPPHGAEIVKFETRFDNRPRAIETLTLVREGRVWKVVGYYID